MIETNKNAERVEMVDADDKVIHHAPLVFAATHHGPHKNDWILDTCATIFVVPHNDPSILRLTGESKRLNHGDGVSNVLTAWIRSPLDVDSEVLALVTGSSHRIIPSKAIHQHGHFTMIGTGIQERGTAVYKGYVLDAFIYLVNHIPHFYASKFLNSLDNIEQVCVADHIHLDALPTDVVCTASSEDKNNNNIIHN